MAILIPSGELLGLYAAGWFPMGDGSGRLTLHSPDPRGILPLEGFRIPHGTRRDLLDRGWEVRVDTAFGEVLLACAGREETWIDGSIEVSYRALHCEGHAHSVEVWRGGELAGGLYGVSLGGAFFGESMFHRRSGASKVALAALVVILRRWGYVLLDTQWVTPHLARFGVVEVSRLEYLRRLREALRRDAGWPKAGAITEEDREAMWRLARLRRRGRSLGEF